MTTEMLTLGIAWYVVFVGSTTLHEAAHAWAAYRMGDPTAYYGGQVSLNPLPHIEREPIGMVLIPILTYLFNGGHWMIGWASAPYDPYWADRHPRRAAWMALAGPAANLLLVVVAGIGIRAGLMLDAFVPPDRAESIMQVVQGARDGPLHSLATLLSIVFMLNLVLLVFNLLPLPPLDGSGALPLLLPAHLVRRYRDFMRQPGFAFLGLIVAWSIFGRVFLPIYIVVLRLLYGGLG